jgi:hypothetical protein
MTTAPHLLVLSALALVGAGCAHNTTAPAVATDVPRAPIAAAPAELAAPTDLATPAAESAAFTQKAGDYVTYRFSGGFRKRALLLTQRVVESTPQLLVLDLAFDDGAHKTSARARYTHAPGAAHELVSASRVSATGQETPMTLAELDALMAQTALAADDNQGSTGSEQVHVTVGGRDIACTQTSYRVIVGKNAATMRTLSSDAFPWGDVGGEITTDQGRVLYRAEVVDMGEAAPIVSASR